MPQSRFPIVDLALKLYPDASGVDEALYRLVVDAVRLYAGELELDLELQSESYQRAAIADALATTVAELAGPKAVISADSAVYDPPGRAVVTYVDPPGAARPRS